MSKHATTSNAASGSSFALVDPNSFRDQFRSDEMREAYDTLDKIRHDTCPKCAKRAMPSYVDSDTGKTVPAVQLEVWSACGNCWVCQDCKFKVEPGRRNKCPTVGCHQTFFTDGMRRMEMMEKCQAILADTTAKFARGVNFERQQDQKDEAKERAKLTAARAAGHAAGLAAAAPPPRAPDPNSRKRLREQFGSEEGDRRFAAHKVSKSNAAYHRAVKNPRVAEEIASLKRENNALRARLGMELVAERAGTDYASDASMDEEE